MSDYQKILIDPLSGSQGHLLLQRLRPGLDLKYEQLTIHTESNLSLLFTPGIRLVFALHGLTRIRIGRQEITFNSHDRCNGALFPVLESALGFKHFRLEKNKSELMILLSNDWLSTSLSDDEYSALRPLLQNHLHPSRFVITPLIRQLLQRICHEHYPQLGKLQQESLCLSLVHEALQQILPLRTFSANEHLQQLAERIDLLLTADTATDLTIAQIASQCHSNPGSVQRIFKQRHGISLGAYRRRMQLDIAHKALAEGATVIQAAQVAGYSHLQSFSDAFRREFGYLPRTVKGSRKRAAVTADKPLNTNSSHLRK